MERNLPQMIDEYQSGGFRPVPRIRARCFSNIPTYLIEEDSSFSKDVSCLHQFPQSLAEAGITIVHMIEAFLMFGQLDV
jgi:hypothetical protein